MGYSNAYTASDFQTNVLSLQKKLQNANGSLKTSLIVQQKNLLNNHIKKLEAVEKKVFNYLDVNSIEELNARLKLIENTNIINFSGINLSNIFVDAMRQKNAAERNLFDKNVRSFLNGLEIPQEFVNYQANKAINIVVGYLNANLKTGQFGFGGSRKGSTGPVKLAGFDEKGYDPQKFSEPMIRRFKELMAEQGLWAFTEDEKGVKKTDQIWIKDNTTEDMIEVVFNWNGDNYTKGYSPSEALKNLTEEEIKSINEKMINGILKYANNDSLMRQILEQFVKEKLTVFFVGDNYKDITGILGEASAIYYLHKLMGKETYDSSIKWKGGVPEDGKKPHQDIVLAGQFGIQVKNTTRQDIIDELGLRQDFISFGTSGYEVNFQSASLPTILENARKNGLSFDASDIFESYFGMLFFNIPYTWAEGKFRKEAVKGGPWDTSPNPATQNYLNARAMLESMEKDIEILIQILASSVMYMQMDNINTSDANILYMVGSAAIFSAVDILKDVKKSLDNINNSNFNIEFENKNDITIVDAINSGLHRKDKRSKIKHYQKTSYSDLTLSSILVKSSYTF